AMAAHYKGRLAELQESGDRSDVTYVANKTGWDARPVALRALADKLSADSVLDGAPAPAISPEFFYALMRAGLPANDTLYHTDAGTLERVWKQGVAQGVIPKHSADQIPSLVRQFQVLSAKKLLSNSALVGASSLKEMLTVSRLTEAQQATFAQLYSAN